MEIGFEVEQAKEIAVRIVPDDILKFAEVSGDFSPLHTDAAFAKQAGFDGVIVHGAFLSALVSRFIGMTFPGPQAILERMDLGFHLPCYAPCDLKIQGTVKQISEAVGTIILEIVIMDAADRIIAKGKTWHKLIGAGDSHE